MPASACSLGCPERALNVNLPLLRYGIPYCRFNKAIMSPRPYFRAVPPILFRHHPPTQLHPRRHIQRSQPLAWRILPHQSKNTVWHVHMLLIPIRRPTFTTLLIPIRRPTFTTLICRLTFATSIPYTIRYLLQSYNLAICIPLVGQVYAIY